MRHIGTLHQCQQLRQMRISIKWPVVRLELGPRHIGSRRFVIAQVIRVLGDVGIEVLRGLGARHPECVHQASQTDTSRPEETMLNECTSKLSNPAKCARLRIVTHTAEYHSEIEMVQKRVVDPCSTAGLPSVNLEIASIYHGSLEQKKVSILDAKEAEPFPAFIQLS